MSKKEKTSHEGSQGEAPMETLEIGNALYTTRLTAKFRNRSVWEKPDERILTAVIPGTIQKVLVHVGDRVEAGTPLLILEAMKMRNEVLAPADGVVRSIHVTEGEQVPKSRVLLELD